MKKIILFFIAFIVIPNLIKAQINNFEYKDSVIATFETGLEGATTWAPSGPFIVDNPEKDELNSSDSVLHFTGSNWEGVALHFDSTEFRNYFTRVQLYVYLDTAATLTMQLDGGYADEITLNQNVADTGKWVKVVYELENPIDVGYKQIWFRTGQRSNFYIDSIVFQSVEPGQWATFEISNIVFGTVDNDTDFSAIVNMRWDTDSIYTEFVVADDSIVATGGGNYQRDNIEVYLDLNNSKGIHWPRGGSWVQAVDVAFDTNDYQIRLIPDSAFDFAANNTVRPGGPSIDTGYYIHYMRTDTGYVFHLNIAWKALDSSFMPEPGTLIGADVLISDADDAAAVNDANRNQITANSPTMFPYNDPSLWATLWLYPGGLFVHVPDTTPPSTPSSLSATANGNNVVLTWTASEDSIAVMRYIIYNGNDSVAAIMALQTGNKYTFSNLAAGNYTLGVVAEDNYGNRSERGTATINFTPGTGIKETEVLFTVTPNPMNDVLEINSQNQIKSVIIMNMAGQIVENKTVNSSQIRINVSNFESGMYFVRVQTEIGTAVQRVIKR